jgi:hypothetical protein
MLPKHIEKAEDLLTKQDDIRDGFLHQALLKTENAIPFIERAKLVYSALSKCKNIKEIIGLKKYRDDLISACGFSEKAKSKMSSQELDGAIVRVLTEIEKSSKKEFREEILYRYLLTKGDALGGRMRNITGSYASLKFIEVIVYKLKKNGCTVKIEKSKTGKIQRLHWEDKTLLFDVTPPHIGKNIDVILLKYKTKKDSKSDLLKQLSNYVACGEIKGGIDPAGADEHWKTARSALDRIREALKEEEPKLFFVAAAIEVAMADEIFTQLNDGRLDYAANLNNDTQVIDLVSWLVAL